MKTPPNTMCVAFNGPPGIGKDTLADLIIGNACGAIHRGTLATMIRTMAAEHYNDPEFPRLSRDRTTKDVPHPEARALGLTPRQMLIHFSEDVIKPQHGADYFAERFAAEMKQHRFSMMTDLGFDVEAHCLADNIDFVVIVQLHHPDFDFAGDSRSYVDIERDNVVVIKHTTDRGNAARDAHLINSKICEAFEAKYR